MCLAGWRPPHINCTSAIVFAPRRDAITVLSCLKAEAAAPLAAGGHGDGIAAKQVQSAAPEKHPRRKGLQMAASRRLGSCLLGL